MNAFEAQLSRSDSLPHDTFWSFVGDPGHGLTPDVKTWEQAKGFAAFLERERDRLRKRVVDLEGYADKLSTALKVASAEAAGLREQLRRQRAVADLVLHPKETTTTETP